MSLEPFEQLELIPSPRKNSAGGLDCRESNYFLAPPKNVLSKMEFLKSLKMEKRRAERTKMPLSLAIFSFREDGNGNIKKITKDFLQYLSKVTRETDIKGYLHDGQIGLLLPDTDQNGLKQCVEKIVTGNGQLPGTIMMGTYPDYIFHKLLSEEDEPDFFPLDLDNEIVSHRFQILLKKMIDIIGALLGIILFSPIMLLLAILVKITSPGPVIFKQVRLGYKGRRFPFYKFRSMYHNINDQIHREYVAKLIQGDLEKINQGKKGDSFFKLKDDPRVTPLGKFIRKTSLDELPQLFNILRGDMSLVGPRPPLPYEVEKYKSWHLRRILDMKPGITGLWQVSGRSKTTFDEMVRLDLRYVQNWSIWLDLKILFKTIREVIFPKGAA
jgi:lipopolysaccharide/colanic/teichoic acid biosynthesis glycosyltransferase